MAPPSSPHLTDARTKHFYRIGEVASLLGVEPHVLRYWEREFRSVRPTKSTRGQRVYSRRDVEELERVRALLYDDGFTIAGAKKQLRAASPADSPRERIEAQRLELVALRDELRAFVKSLGA